MNVNGKDWWVWAVILVLLLALLWWAFGPYGRAKNSASSKDGVNTEVTTDNTNQLKEQLAACNAALVQANQTIALLAECCGSNKTVTYTKPAAPRSTGGSGNTGNTVRKFVPAPSGTRTETVIEGATLPRAKRSMEKGEIEACWQFGQNVWYPYIAIQEDNLQFPNLVDNGKDGNNLAFLPSGTIGSTGASCGIAKDGTHWLRVSEAQKYQAWVTFDTPRPMIEGVFVPSTVTEINGEQFFIAR